nr:MAG TPA: hypothetical protein [Caudoviricetes sp.]
MVVWCVWRSSFTTGSSSGRPEQNAGMVFESNSRVSGR